MRPTHHPHHRRLLVIPAIIATLLWSMFTPVPAHAATTSASACLNKLAGATAVVNTYQGITLKCGNSNGGIIHIDHDHPISRTGADDVDIKECMNNIISRGSRSSSDPGNTARGWRTPSGYYAIIVWRTLTDEVVTMYIQGTRYGNEWDRCD